MSRVTILHDVAASPDHARTRLYKAGEQHVVGSSLMPQGLADLLVKGGAFVPVKIAVSGTEGIMHVPKEEVPAAKLDNKPLDAEWREIVTRDKYGIDKTRLDLMHDELFGNSIPLHW